MGISIIGAGGSDLKKMLMHAKILKAYDLPCIIVLDKDKYKESQEIEARGHGNVKLVHALEKGNFEEYLPVDIMVEVINELCLKECRGNGNLDLKEISVFDIDRSRGVENQLRQLVLKQAYPRLFF